MKRYCMECLQDPLNHSRVNSFSVEDANGPWVMFKDIAESRRLIEQARDAMQDTAATAGARFATFADELTQLATEIETKGYPNDSQCLRDKADRIRQTLAALNEWLEVKDGPAAA